MMINSNKKEEIAINEMLGNTTPNNCNSENSYLSKQCSGNFKKDSSSENYADFQGSQLSGNQNGTACTNKTETESGNQKNGNISKTETASDNPDGSVETKKNGFSLRTITVVGQIEGHSELPQSQKSTKYELLIPQLVEIEENDEIDALLLILNTVGGDVEAGLALSELIAGMKKPTASLVLGGGHSIGVPLAVSAKRSFIVPTATMTLHPVRISGLVLGAPQTFVQMERMQERIVSFVSGHSGISPERLRTLMLSSDEMTTDLGTILDGKAAVSEGLIDKIGSLSDATEYLKKEARKRQK